MFNLDWQNAWIEHEANPSDHTTNEEFCALNHVSVPTLWRFRKENIDKLNDEIEKARKKYRTSLRSAVYNALERRIQAGSDRAIELGLKVLGDLVERSESKVDYLTPDMKRERIAKMLANVLKKDNKNKDNSKNDKV